MTRTFNPHDILSIADLFVEDILSKTDEEILAEYRSQIGDPNAFATLMRSFINDKIMSQRKLRLKAAQEAIAIAKSTPSATSNVISITRARAHIHTLKNNASQLGLTLAARNESELSDQDIIGIIEELAELDLINIEDFK